MKSLYFILYFVFAIGFSAQGQTFTIIKPTINYPNFENLLYYFDENFQPLNIDGNSIELKVNGTLTKNDSILFQNSAIPDSASFFVGVELSGVLTPRDKSYIKSFINYLLQVRSKQHLNLIIFFFNSNSINVIDEFTNDISNIDKILESKFYVKPDLNKLSNSASFQNFLNSESNKSLILITKSSPALNISSFSQMISDNKIELVNLSLNESKNKKFIDLANITKSTYLKLSDFRTSNQFSSVAIFIALGGKPTKVFWNTPLEQGKNKFSISFNTLSDSIGFNLFPNQIPKLLIENRSQYFGIIESGNSITKNIRLGASSSGLKLSKIEVENPNFQLMNFVPNQILKPGEPIDIKIQYNSASSQFVKSKIIFTTNNSKKYNAYLYAGEKPNLSETEINFFDTDKTIFENEPYRISWEGTFPLDTFKIDYKPSADTNWVNITSTSSGNEFKWIVPDISNNKIDIRVSQSSTDLVSDKVIQLKGHKQRITDLAWSPDDSLIATSSEDGKILLWEVKSGKLIKTLFQAQSKIISGIDWSSDGKYLAISASDTLVKIWNIENEILHSELKSPENTEQIKFIAQNSKIVGILESGDIIIWNFDSSKVDKLIHTGSSKINVLEINNSSNYFATGSQDGKVILWDFQTGQKVKDIYSTSSPILGLSFSPSGNNIAVSTYDNRIRIFDISTAFNVLSLFDTGTPIYAVNWLANKQFITSTLGNDIRLWTPTDGMLINNYDQHNSPVYFIKSSHKGNLISSIETNNIIHIWSPFDFPFDRPALISKVFPDNNLRHKIIIAPILELPILQKGDSLYFFDNNFAENISDFDIKIDTCLTPKNFPNLNFINSPSNEDLEAGGLFSAELEYIPTDSLLQETKINIISGNKSVPKNIRAFVLTRFFDRKAYTINFGTVELGKFKDTTFFGLQNISFSSFLIDSVKFLSMNDNSFLLQKPTMPYTMQPLGGAFVPNISFIPQKIGYTFGIFRIFLKNSIPVDIQLVGNAVAPMLRTDSIQHFGQLICETSITKIIPLKNIGNSELIIKNVSPINDSDNEISLLEMDKKNIAPGDSAKLKVIINPKTTGLKNLQIKINTNLQNYFLNENNIFLSFTKDSVNVLPDSLRLDFYPKSDLDQVTKVLKLENTGNINSKLNIRSYPTFFELDSIQYLENNIFLHMKFIGGKGLPEYLDSISFTDDCDKKTSISLLAFPGKPEALLYSQNIIDFGLIKCSAPQEQLLRITNKGSDTLKIYRFYLKNNSTSLIIPDIKNYNILPNNELFLPIKFESLSAVNITDTLVIESNASNSDAGNTFIAINAKKILLLYNFTENNVIVTDLTLNTEYSFTITLNNKSEIPLPVNLSNSNINFNYNLSGITNIPARDSVIIHGIFFGKDEPSVNFDTLTFTDECGESKKVEIEISVRYKDKDFFKISNVFPNPSNSKFYIDMLSNSRFSYSYRVFDNIGKPIMQSPIFTDKADWDRIEINLENYSIGIYLLEISTNKGKFTRKLIKLE